MNEINLPQLLPTKLSVLTDDFLNGKIFVPKYQRCEGVWKDNMKSNLIKSILLGFPLGEIILNRIVEKDGSTKYALVDGQQRTTTIKEFIKGDFKLTEEVSRDIIKRWYIYFESKSFSDKNIANILQKFSKKIKINLSYFDLIELLQNRINDYLISTNIVFLNDEDCKVYFRMVQSGEKLKEHDMIHTIDSKIKDKVNDISNSKKFLSYFGLLKNENKNENKFIDMKKNITKNIIESLAVVSSGRSLGIPNNLHIWLMKQDENDLIIHNNIVLIKDFINNINIVNDNNKYSQTTIKLASILIMLGYKRIENFDNTKINDYANFVFYLVNDVSKLSNLNNNNVIEFLNGKKHTFMYEYYFDNIEIFINFSKLSSSQQSKEKVFKATNNLIDLYIKHNKNKKVENLELIEV